jgi:Protein of unknown function (DUF1186)
VWDGLAVDSADIEALEVFPELRRAYDDGLIDPQCVGRSELDAVETMPRGEMVRRTRERHPPIDDVADATAWWDRRSRDTDDEDDRLLHEDDEWEAQAGATTAIAEPYRAPAKVGRNEPVPAAAGRNTRSAAATDGAAVRDIR